MMNRRDVLLLGAGGGVLLTAPPGIDRPANGRLLLLFEQGSATAARAAGHWRDRADAPPIPVGGSLLGIWCETLEPELRLRPARIVGVTNPANAEFLRDAARPLGLRQTFFALSPVSGARPVEGLAPEPWSHLATWMLT